MSNLVSDIIHPVRLRIWRLRILQVFFRGLSAGLVVACVWSLLGYFFPLANYRLLAVIWVVCGALGGLLYGLWKRPGEKEAASEMDRSGLEERMSTALAYIRDGSPIVKLQREDAMKYGAVYVRQLREKLPLHWERKDLAVNGCLVVILSALLLWPNAMDAEVFKRQQDKSWIKQQVQATEQKLESLQEAQVNSEAARSLEAVLRELKAGLTQSNTTKEALLRMEQAMQKLQQLAALEQKQLVKSAQWEQALQSNAELHQLNESLKQGSTAEAAKGIQRAQQDIKRMSAAQKRQLAEELERSVESAKTGDAAKDQALRDSLNALAQQAREAANKQEAQARNGSSGGKDGEKANDGKAETSANADSADISEAQLKQLAAAMAAARQQALQGQQTLAQAQQTSAQLSQAGQPMAQQLAAAQGGAVSPAWNSGGRPGSLASSGAAPSPGSATGGAAGASSGGGTGQSGTRSGGVSAGGPGAAGASGGSAGGAAGAGGSKGGVGNGSRSLVAAPRTPIGGGKPMVDQGPLQGSGGEQQQGGQSPMIDGASRPYEEVYTQYADEASRSLDRSPLPQSMQNLVKNYFTEIEPAN